MDVGYVIASYRNGKIYGYVSQDYGAYGGFVWRSFTFADLYRSKDEALKVLKEPEFSLYGYGDSGSMIRSSAGICRVNPTGEVDIRIQPVVLGRSVFTIQGNVQYEIPND